MDELASRMMTVGCFEKGRFLSFGKDL